MFYSKKLLNFNNINHCFFSRKNGVSKGIYSSLNCGIGSNDNKINVEQNIKIALKSNDLDLKEIKMMNQTHSNKVTIINEINFRDKKFESDAVITRLNGIILGVLTADCVPIIIYDDSSKMIGCIHAGWKGSFEGIIGNTINEFKNFSNLKKIYSCIGPCIGKKSYEVDQAFKNKFIDKDNKNEKFFTRKNDKYLFDLRGFVYSQLRNCGIENIDNIDKDTFADKENFFSYRRSQKKGEKDYGRCLSIISLK